MTIMNKSAVFYGKNRLARH